MFFDESDLISLTTFKNFFGVKNSTTYIFST